MNFKHGHSTRKKITSEYACWASMIQRCHNPNHKFYYRYGGRGISVCSRWRNDFKNFLSDMGERPIGLTIERVNLNGDYSPENCVWADWSKQNLNKNNAIRILHLGKELTMKEYADLHGISYQAVAKQVQRAKKSKRNALLNGSVIRRTAKVDGSVVPR